MSTVEIVRKAATTTDIGMVESIRKGLEKGDLNRDDLHGILVERAEVRRRDGESNPMSYARNFTGHDASDRVGAGIFKMLRDCEVITAGLGARHPEAIARVSKVLKADEGRSADHDSTAPGMELDEMAAEHRQKNPHLTHQQAYAHVATATDRGRHLFAQDKKQRAFIAAGHAA